MFTSNSTSSAQTKSVMISLVMFPSSVQNLTPLKTPMLNIRVKVCFHGGS
jgi:hypothetical protein